MSEDERLEAELKSALRKVTQMPRPVQRERIFKEICRDIMLTMGWEQLAIKPIGGEHK